MEEKIKEFRKLLLKQLENQKITFYEWERIRNYVDEKYECTKQKSTL